MALVVLLSQPAFCPHPAPPSPTPPLPPSRFAPPPSLFSCGSSSSWRRLVCSCKQEEFFPSSSSASSTSSSSSRPAAAVGRRGRNWNLRRSCIERISSSSGDSSGSGNGFESLIHELGNVRSANEGAGEEETAAGAGAAEESGRPAATTTEKNRNNRSGRRRLLALSLLALGLTTTTATGSSTNGSSAAAAAAAAGAEELGSPADVRDVDDDDDDASNSNVETPPGVIVDKFPEDAIQEQIIGDVFGFDGLGKLPEEYVLGKVVALAQAGDGAVVFLGVDGFELPLQLVVGPAEAMAVLTAVQERKSRRPVTHEAWGLSLAAVGWKVDRVVITANEKDIFYSNVVLSNLPQVLSSTTPAGRKSVDMRPSDGIALALRCRAPLFVRRKVAEEILGPKTDPSGGGKEQADPLLKQPGLQADNSRGSFSSAVTPMERSLYGSTSPHENSGYGPWKNGLQWTS